MVIGRDEAKIIEGYLFNARSYKRMLDEARETKVLTFAAGDEVKVKSYSISDPTFNAAESILSSDTAKWIDVIDMVIRRFEGTDIGRLITDRYFKKKSWQQTCTDLYIEKRTYYSWINDIVIYTCIKAVEAGVMKVR